MFFLNSLDGEEKILFSRVEELKNLAENRYQSQFTRFLNPREQKIAFAATKQKGSLFGGYNSAVRQVAGFPAPYEELNDSDFPIKGIELVHEKDIELPHQWVLGSMMALGITRDSVGDLLPEAGRCVILTTIPVVSIVLNELKQVGSVGVKAKEIGLKAIKSSQEYISITGTISSNRLDNLISLLINKSRSVSANIITSGKVQLNYKEEVRITTPVEHSDVITVRGYGKFIFDNMGKPTRKGRFPVECRKYR